MARKMLIDATHPEETRVVVVNGNKVEEFDFDATSSGLITGNVYLAKVSRIEPSLQAAFVDYGGNRHGFLAFSEVHPDYFQIPLADREALIAEELAAQEAEADDEDQDETEEDVKPRKSRTRRRRNNKTIAEDAQEEASIKSEIIENAEENAETKKPRSRTRRSRKKPEAVVEDTNDENDSNDDQADTVTDSAEEEVEVVREQRRKPSGQRIRIHQRYKIQEVLKVRQVMLVQIIKEERGNKGAALTTYLSMPGRYCVLMPNTARGGGISRKISNIQDRKRLKTLAKSLNIPRGAGLIIRTAGASQDSDEIKRDYDFLIRQWDLIRELTLKSTAPTAVYAETGPVKRAIRDLLTQDCDEILIEGKSAFDEASEYMNVLMPDRVKNVKLYEDSMPLFSRYQVESHLSSMFNPTVQLPSGGYLVFGVTEALIAVDVNSGRSTRSSSIEETAHKTNLEAAEEVARQLKLRDLAGLIVIDFIDMEQRRHQQEVENKLKDALRKDRARIQVGRISNFGLLEMSRQRLRTGLVEAITKPCPHCNGTGIQRSDDSVALAVIRAIEEEIARGRSNEIIAHVPMSIANYLFNEKRSHILGFDDRHGVTVKIVADHDKIAPDFELEKNKVEGKALPNKVQPITLESDDEDGEGRNKRRRRRGGRNRNKSQANENETQNNDAQVASDTNENNDTTSNEQNAELAEDKPRRSRRRTRKPNTTNDAETSTDASNDGAVTETAPIEPAAEADEKPKRTRRRRTPAKVDQVEAEATSENVVEPAPEEKPKPTRRPRKSAATTEAAEASEAEKPKPKPRTRRKKIENVVERVEAEAPREAPTEEKPKRKPRAKKAEPIAENVAPVVNKAEPAPEPKAEEPAKPKRKGWWSL